LTELGYFTLTGNLTAVVIDYVDAGDLPDLQKVSATVDIIPRIPSGQLVWASGLTPKVGLALAPFKARFDTDGYLRTIAAQAQNEIQTITVTGTPSGSFPLTFGAATATIPFGSASSAVETALEALSTIGAGNVSVGGPTGGPWQVAFTGVFAATDVALMTTTHGSVGIQTTRVGALNAGVKLVANTDAINLDQLIYDLVFSNVVYNRRDQTIHPIAFVASNVADVTVDMADLEWITPAPGIG
jgi:hypothetical protein